MLRFIRALLPAMLALAGCAAPAAAQATGDAALTAQLEDLVVANRILAQEGILDVYGHVSARHPSRPDHYLMSRSRAPILVTADDIMEYDLDSQPIDPHGRRSVIERYIHGEIYKARPDVKAVIHTHSPTVVPFSVSEVPLRPVAHVASFLYVGVPVWDSRDVDDPDAVGMLVRNAALGKSLAQALGNKPVVLLRGHGDVVAAADVRTAVRYAFYTEVNARLQATAIALGGQVKYLSAEEGAAREKREADTDRGWELWKRKALGQ